MTDLYTMHYRPVMFSTLPPGVRWRFYELPRSLAHLAANIKAETDKISDRVFGVFTTDRPLTADELRDYEIDVVKLSTIEVSDPLA